MTLELKLPEPAVIRQMVAAALAEDTGSGDRTAVLILPAQQSTAEVVCREAAVLCGRAWFDEVFQQLDKRIRVSWLANDGATLAAGSPVCHLQGPAQALLSGERSALNFLQLLSATATTTRHHVDAVRDYPVHILDTRKTLPGLRQAQKYAVLCGGGHNHRLGLYDAILIKENHIAAAGSIAAAVERARAEVVPIEVEVENLDQLQQAIEAGAEHLLLDNFELPVLSEAVALARGRARLEASGNVNLGNIRAIAATGVDDISIGALTKHVHAIDFSMRIVNSE